MASVYYRINESNLSHNCFDDEIIVVHLELGTYFSLYRTARTIWQALENSPQSSASLLAIFDETPDVAAHEIESFLETLKSHQLIVEADDAAVPDRPSPDLEVEAYAPPELESFDDLQELLLADIIHDTDESGWPYLADGGSGENPAHEAA